MIAGTIFCASNSGPMHHTANQTARRMHDGTSITSSLVRRIPAFVRVVFRSNPAGSGDGDSHNEQVRTWR